MIQIEDIFEVNKQVICSRVALSKMIGRPTQSIIAYEKDDGTRTPLKRLNNKDFGIDSRKVYYNLNYALSWHDKNIQKRTTKNHIGVTSGEKSYSGFLNSLPPHKKQIWEDSNLDPLDKMLKLEDIAKKEIANKVASGQYIDINSVDKDMAVLATLMKSTLVSFEKASPSLLYGKEEDEIMEIISDANYTLMTKLDEVIGLEFETNETMYDVVSLIVQKLGEESPKTIMDKINDTK